MEKVNWMAEPNDECSRYHIGCDEYGKVKAINIKNELKVGEVPWDVALRKDSLSKSFL